MSQSHTTNNSKMANWSNCSLHRQIMTPPVKSTATGELADNDEGPSSRSSSSSTVGYGIFQNHQYLNSTSINEIEEEGESSAELFEIKGVGGGRNPSTASMKEEAEGSLFSYNVSLNGEGDDIVYVAVFGKSFEESSMDALDWTLNHVVNPSSTVVYLIHVIPEIRHIPTPLGKLPINQVNPEQKERYMVQERSKRRDFLQKFLDLCSASKVKVETILIESDMEANSILDLVPILNIRKLVVGTTSPNLRKMKSRKGGGIVDQIRENAPEYCEVKIICEGKEVVDKMMMESPPPRSGSNDGSPKPTHHPNHINEASFTCNFCFRSKVTAPKCQ